MRDIHALSWLQPNTVYGVRVMAIDLSDSDLFKTSSYVGGEWMPDSPNRLAVTNPATGEVIAEVATIDASGTAKAIAAAHDAM